MTDSESQATASVTDDASASDATGVATGVAEKRSGGTLGNRGGHAPKGNLNSLKHGLSMAVYRWSATGKLPRKFKHLRTELRKLRASLEAAVERHNDRAPTIQEHKLITDVVRHEGIARLAENRLARESESLNVADFVLLLTKIGTATDSGTKSLRSLGLDREVDPYTAMYGRTMTLPTLNGHPTPRDASGQAGDVAAETEVAPAINLASGATAGHQASRGASRHSEHQADHGNASDASTHNSAELQSDQSGVTQP